MRVLGLKQSILALLGTAGFIAVSSSALVSCAPSLDDEVYVTQCSLPADQKNTLSGRWRSFPVYISFRETHFNTLELGLMMDAADRWNAFFTATQGIQILDYGSRSHPRMTTREKPLNLCGTNMVNTDGSQATSVTIYKNATWPTTSGYSSAAIALTSFCTNTSSPVNVMKSAMMELNYQHFFVNGTPVPDLTSILVHEFGHLLGLDHSCDNSTSATVKPPKCSAPTIDETYFDAVMYPTVNFKSDGNGVIKRSLNVNDQGRANCLYGGTAL